MPELTIAQRLFEAYAAAANWVSVTTGNAILPWEEQTSAKKILWAAVAEKAVELAATGELEGEDDDDYEDDDEG